MRDGTRGRSGCHGVQARPDAATEGPVLQARAQARTRPPTHAFQKAAPLVLTEAINCTWLD